MASSSVTSLARPVQNLRANPEFMGAVATLKGNFSATQGFLEKHQGNDDFDKFLGRVGEMVTKVDESEFVLAQSISQSAGEAHRSIMKVGSDAAELGKGLFSVFGNSGGDQAPMTDAQFAAAIELAKEGVFGVLNVGGGKIAGVSAKHLGDTIAMTQSVARDTISSSEMICLNTLEALVKVQELKIKANYEMVLAELQTVGAIYTTHVQSELEKYTKSLSHDYNCLVEVCKTALTGEVQRLQTSLQRDIQEIKSNTEIAKGEQKARIQAKQKDYELAVKKLNKEMEIEKTKILSEEKVEIHQLDTRLKIREAELANEDNGWCSIM